MAVSLLTIEDMVAKFGDAEMRQIAGDGRHNSDVGVQFDELKIASVFNYVSELVVGYVAAKYPWLREVATMPEPLKGYACDIARFRFRTEAGNASQVSDDVEKRCKEAIAFLKDVQSGKFNLAPATDLEGEEEVAILPVSSAQKIHIVDSGVQTSQLLEGW